MHRFVFAITVKPSSISIFSAYIYFDKFLIPYRFYIIYKIESREAERTSLSFNSVVYQRTVRAQPSSCFVERETPDFIIASQTFVLWITESWPCYRMMMMMMMMTMMNRVKQLDVPYGIETSSAT